MNLTSITKARLYTFALTLLVMIALMLSACNAPGADEEPSTDGGPRRITTSSGTHPLEDGLPEVLHNLLDTPLGDVEAALEIVPPRLKIVDPRLDIIPDHLKMVADRQKIVPHPLKVVDDR